MMITLTFLRHYGLSCVEIPLTNNSFTLVTAVAKQTAKPLALTLLVLAPKQGQGPYVVYTLHK